MARTPKDKAARGRPSSYTEAKADEIAKRLSTGEPLAQICRDEHMPDTATVWRWTQTDAEFSQRIAHAREVGFDVLAGECLSIANTPVEGIETVNKADGTVETRVGDMLGHRKLQIETRLKLLAKWDPKRYGDRLDLNHGGEVEHKLSPEMAAWLNQRG